jgi:hypothetical protein
VDLTDFAANEIGNVNFFVFHGDSRTSYNNSTCAQ